MDIFNLKKIRNIIGHVIFWAAVWFFFIYFFSYNSSDLVYITWFSSCLLPLTMVVAYFVVYKLIPNFLFKGKYALLALYSFYILVFSSYIIVLSIYGCLIFLLQFNTNRMPPMSKNYFFVLVLVFLVVGLVSLLKILEQSFQTASRNKALQNKILETQLQLKEQELHYLKSQIHPHFLFNTLNTIYGLALQSSRHTPDVILRLSDLLDYILYKINQPQVRLSEEVDHIRQYIELERIRFQDSLKVDLKISPLNEEAVIAPMMLIPFVENAFKHGNLVDGFLQVKMEVALQNRNLYFSLSNTMEENRVPIKKGIGLENIQKRLEMYYPNRYELTHQQEDGWYTVTLFIKEIL